LERTEAPSLSGSVPTAFLVAIAYYIGAQLAFFIGTLSDKIFAPFWPPNVILFCALLLTPTRRWWIYIAAAFPVHVAAELGVAMPWPALVGAFLTNVIVATMSAAALKAFSARRPWLGDLRKASLYIVTTALVSPAVTALGGAFVPILSGGALGNFWQFWAQWWASNALGALTLAPIVLIWLCEPWEPTASISRARRLEAVVLTIALVVACGVTFEVRTGAQTSSLLPALLYLPLPLILWATLRFGVKGASGAIFIVTVVLIWRTLNSQNLF